MAKKRGNITYQHKINRVTKWYNHIVAYRQERDGLGKDKKPLRELEFFLDKIKKPTN